MALSPVDGEFHSIEADRASSLLSPIVTIDRDGRLGVGRQDHHLVGRIHDRHLTPKLLNSQAPPVIPSCIDIKVLNVRSKAFHRCIHRPESGPRGRTGNQTERDDNFDRRQNQARGKGEHNETGRRFRSEGGSRVSRGPLLRDGDDGRLIPATVIVSNSPIVPSHM